MQALGTTESSQQGVHLLVVRPGLLCEETSKMCGLAHEVEHGAAQQGTLQPRNTDVSWAVGIGRWVWGGASNGRAHLVLGIG